MVTQSMLRIHAGKYVFSEKKYLICDCSRVNQMPLTDQITEPASAPISELLSNIITMIELKY